MKHGRNATNTGHTADARHATNTADAGDAAYSRYAAHSGHASTALGDNGEKNSPT